MIDLGTLNSASIKVFCLMCCRLQHKLVSRELDSRFLSRPDGATFDEDIEPTIHDFHRITFCATSVAGEGPDDSNPRQVL